MFAPNQPYTTLLDCWSNSTHVPGGFSWFDERRLMFIHQSRFYRFHLWSSLITVFRSSSNSKKKKTTSPDSHQFVCLWAHFFLDTINGWWAYWLWQSDKCRRSKRLTNAKRSDCRHSKQPQQDWAGWQEQVKLNSPCPFHFVLDWRKWRLTQP